MELLFSWVTGLGFGVLLLMLLTGFIGCIDDYLINGPVVPALIKPFACEPLRGFVPIITGFTFWPCAAN